VTRDDPGIPGVVQRPLDLFVFADGDPEKMQLMMDKGVFPWTTDPHLKLAFFRPLSAATHQLDRAIAPESPGFAHAHNLLWFAALLLVLGALYRRLHLTPWVAGLALLLFAIDDTHGPTLGWVANRQALIAATVAFSALILHDRWRRNGWNAGRWLGPLVYGVSLLAGESALALTGFLFAYALCLDRGPMRTRALSLSGFALVTIIWMVGYSVAGYGAARSGVYVDPGADPVDFIGLVAVHAPVLLTSQMSGLLSDVFAVLSDGWDVLYVSVCLVYLILLLDVLKVVLAKSALARFWALSMVLAVIPICSTAPADRLLIFVGVAAMGLVATFLYAPEGVSGVRSPSKIRRFSVKAWTWGLVFTHLIAAPIFLPLRAQTMTTVNGALERSYDSIPNTPEVEAQTVIAVNPPSDPYMAYVPLMRASRRDHVPGRQRWLAVGQSDVTVTREDGQTLLVRPEAGYLALSPEQLVRRPENRFKVGEVVSLAGVDVTVTALTADGRPAESRWRFEKPLEDPGYVWLRWGDEALSFVPFELPASGATVTLEAVDTIRAFVGDF
jgi:hypothetical protein